MENSKNPLTAGLSGTVYLFDEASNYVTGKPSDEAILIVDEPAEAVEYSGFGYDQGAATHAGLTPARRFHLGLRSSVHIAVDGLDLLTLQSAGSRIAYRQVVIYIEFHSTELLVLMPPGEYWPMIITLGPMISERISQRCQ